MFQNKNFLAVLAILLLINGCNNDKPKQKNDTAITSNIPVNKTINKDNDEKLLEEIGIYSKDDKIIIEPKKTEAFFKKLAKKLQKEAEKIQQKVKKINEKDLGIEKDSSKIIIDINKTEKTLNQFGKELEKISKELEKIFDK